MRFEEFARRPLARLAVATAVIAVITVSVVAAGSGPHNRAAAAADHAAGASPLTAYVLGADKVTPIPTATNKPGKPIKVSMTGVVAIVFAP